MIIAIEGIFHFEDVELVIFKDPHTIINWVDGSKTIVKCMDGDKFDEHVGFQAAVTKKVFGDHGTYKKLIMNAQRQEPKPAPKKRLEIPF